MKKRIIAGVLAAAMVFSMTACGSKNEANEVAPDAGTPDISDASVEVSDESKGEDYYTNLVANADLLAGLTGYNVDDYVTLGDYNGITIEFQNDYSVSDDAVESYVQEMIAGYVDYIKTDETEVRIDSYVNVDYKGIRDGEAFEGGSSENVTIDVAGNCSPGGGGYIEGFTSGLPGSKVGDTVEYEVTFPDNYGNADLAGVTVIFQFKINYICEVPTAEKIREMEAAGEKPLEKLGVESMDELYEASRDYLEYYAASNRENELEDKVLETLANQSQVNIPEEVIGAQLKCICNIYTDTYCTEGQNLADITQENFGVSYEEFLAAIVEQMTPGLTNQLIFEAIAKAENITTTDEEYDEYMAELSTSNGYEDVSSFYTANGFEDDDTAKAYFLNVCNQNKAFNHVLDRTEENIAK